MERLRNLNTAPLPDEWTKLHPYAEKMVARYERVLHHSSSDGITALTNTRAVFARDVNTVNPFRDIQVGDLEAAEKIYLSLKVSDDLHHCPVNWYQ
jgi:hypothetical protein